MGRSLFGPIIFLEQKGSMRTKLTDLTYKQYTNLKTSGLMFEVYPEATGDYDRDVPYNNFEVPDVLSEMVEITLRQDNSFLCGFKFPWARIWDELSDPYNLNLYKEGKRMGGTRSFWRLGNTKLRAFQAFYSEIRGSYLLNEQLKRVEYVE
jgi:hypothetical protein